MQYRSAFVTAFCVRHLARDADLRRCRLSQSEPDKLTFVRLTVTSASAWYTAQLIASGKAKAHEPYSGQLVFRYSVAK
jgi:hypothetical protein